MSRASMQPFRGIVCPGIWLEAGHGFAVISFESTPTAIEAYDEIWHVATNGDRTLYVDPEGAGALVQPYHAFDRTVGASLDWHAVEESSIAFTMAGDDGVDLSVRLGLRPTAGTRLLGAVDAITPRSIRRSRLGETVSNLGFSLAVDASGLKVAGRTETGEPYRVEPRSLLTVSSAEVEFDGADLGSPATPPAGVAFGDVVFPDRGVVVFGDLYLRPPQHNTPGESIPPRR